MKKNKNPKLPAKTKSSIIKYLRKKIQRSYEIKFNKNIDNHEKRVKYWNKLEDDNKIKLIKLYSEIPVRYSDRNLDEYSKFMNQDFRKSLMKDLWENSNYRVQCETYIQPYRTEGNTVININHVIINDNWKFTNPELQKQYLREIIGGFKHDCDLKWFEVGKADVYNLNYHKCGFIINKIEGMKPEDLLEIYDEIVQFLEKHASDEQLKSFGEKLPPEVRKEKIENTVESSLLKIEAFNTKWNSLSYDEKILKMKIIFEEYIIEYEKWDGKKKEGIIQRITSEEKRWTVSIGGNNKREITCDPKVIKVILSDIKKGDLNRYLCEIIEMKKKSPYTLYFIWNALDKTTQCKYYDKVMEILKDNPQSIRYGIWYASKCNSIKKAAYAKKILDGISSIEEINEMRRIKKLLIKGKKRVQEENKKKTGHSGETTRGS